MSKIVILGRNYGKKAHSSCPDLYILMDLGLYVIIFYVFCKQDEKFNKRTLFDDFLIFIPLILPTMVILKQQNTVKRSFFRVVAFVLGTTLFDDFLINFIHLNLPTMVILMENRPKAPFYHVVAS